MTRMARRWLLLVSGAVLLAGCPEEIEPEGDRLPPESTATLVYPSGATLDLAHGQTIRVNTVDVGLRLEVGEPGILSYTLDGSDPAGPGATRVELQTTVTLRETTTVRWFGTDDAGNAEAPRQVVVEFDRTPPTVRVDPPPGQYFGRLVVTVSADEPGRAFWTVDGSPPVRGTPTTSDGALPVDIELELPVDLRLVVEDTVGNDVALPPLAYVIDAEAPITLVEPPPGRYLAPVDVALTTDDPTGVVRFTLDGSTPDETSAVYAAPIRVDRDLTLTVRAYDEGGNAEDPRPLSYEIGSRGALSPMAEEQPELFPFAGGLRMAAALVDASGGLAGRPGAASTGADWVTWSLGRMAIDATLLYSGLGPHAMNSIAMIDVSAAGEGVPDENGNDSNLDETFFARVDALAARAGESRVPDGLHPSSVVLAAGDATLAAALSVRRTQAGRPAWSDDYRQMRWSGVAPDGAATGADLLAAGLRALATRARSALSTDHPVGDGDYARQAAPVVGLRCVSCHGASTEPPIAGAAELEALGLLDGPAPRLLALLAGDEAHPVDPAMPEEVAAVAAWIEGGAGSRGDAERRPGPDPREGLLGLLAVEHAGILVHEATERLLFDVERNRLSPGDPARAQYPVGAVDLIIGAGPTGTPALDVVQVTDRTFSTAAQSRLLAALVDWIELADARPDLFEGPLAGSAAFPGIIAEARPLAGRLVDALTERVAGDEGVPRASWNPGSGRAAQVEARALAEFAVAMRAAGAALDRGDAASAAAGALRFLVDELRGPEGDYADAWRDGERVRGVRVLGTQWAALRALLDAAAAGDADAFDAAEALWGRIDGMWFDPGARVWQTVRGLESWIYDPALVALTLDGLRAAAEADLPQAEQRLADALDRLVIPFVWADTWLSGETAAGADVDRDGLPKPQDAGPVTGAAPVFRRAMSL